jgi:hypothetical protein
MVSLTVALFIVVASGGVSASDGDEVSTKVATPAVPRKPRRDVRERSGGIVSMAATRPEFFDHEDVLTSCCAGLARYCGGWRGVARIPKE